MICLVLYTTVSAHNSVLNHNQIEVIMISSDLTKSIVDWIPVSDRFMIAQFESNACQLTFIKVNAPTEHSRKSFSESDRRIEYEAW